MTAPVQPNVPTHSPEEIAEAMAAKGREDRRKERNSKIGKVAAIAAAGAAILSFDVLSAYKAMNSKPKADQHGITADGHRFTRSYGESWGIQLASVSTDELAAGQPAPTVEQVTASKQPGAAPTPELKGGPVKFAGFTEGGEWGYGAGLLNVIGLGGVALWLRHRKSRNSSGTPVAPASAPAVAAPVTPVTAAPEAAVVTAVDGTPVVAPEVVVTAPESPWDRADRVAQLRAEADAIEAQITPPTTPGA